MSLDSKWNSLPLLCKVLTRLVFSQISNINALWKMYIYAWIDGGINGPLDSLSLIRNRYCGSNLQRSRKCDAFIAYIVFN